MRLINPSLLPNGNYSYHIIKISFSKKEGIKKYFSYERRVYESVDEESLLILGNISKLAGIKVPGSNGLSCSISSSYGFFALWIALCLAMVISVKCFCSKYTRKNIYVWVRVSVCSENNKLIFFQQHLQRRMFLATFLENVVSLVFSNICWKCYVCCFQQHLQRMLCLLNKISSCPFCYFCYMPYHNLSRISLRPHFDAKWTYKKVS